MKKPETQMEILIEDIPEEGLEIAATEKDAWLATCVREALGDAYGDRSTASFHASMHKVEANVSIDGEVTMLAQPACDRCLEEYDERFQVALHVNLAPLYESKREKERFERLEVELVKEDLDFAYYEGDRFDLGEVLREQIILAEPMQHLCKDSCQGLCQRCGKNLNEGPCACGEEASSSFSALRGVVVDK